MEAHLLSDLNVAQLAIILIAGAAAGFINTMAGGGSLLTIPALLFAGLPASLANGTNRVGIVMQNTVAAVRFRQGNAYRLREALPMLLPAFAGSVAGALIAVELDPRVFDVVLGVVLLLMLTTLFVKPRAMLTAEGANPSAAVRVGRVVVFGLIGFYGGFVQAGVGFLLIVGITSLFGYDLVKTNAVKMLIVGLYSLLALAIFAVNGQVLWLHGVVLGAGTVTGAVIGVRVSLTRGTGVVKAVIVVAVVLTALRLFGLLG